MERNFCQLPGWCPGNFQWQASLLQSEVVSNYFFQSWNINHQHEFAKKSFRSDITVVCKAMEFGLYPLDNHKCYLILTSCKCGQLLKYCQMIQYFQTSNNICFIYNIIYIVWSTLQMFLSCDHITMFFHSRIRSTHPHLIHMTYFSLCSQTRFAISWQIKRPPISEYCPYSITISTFDQSSSSFYRLFSVGYDSQHMVLAGKWMYRLEMTFHELLIIKGMSMIRSVRRSWPA